MLTLIKDARVLTLDEADGEHLRADILIRGDTIEAVAPDLTAEVTTDGVRVIEAAGKLAMPGLVNGHFHSPANFMKGALDNWPLELFMLYEVPPLMREVVSARFAYVRTMLGAMEMLRQGVTSVHDDCFFVPVVTQTEVDNVMQAYEDAGIRATVTLDQPNVVEHAKYPFLKDLLPPHLRERMEAVPLMSDGELLAHYEGFLERWHGRAGGRLRCAVSCSAPQRVTPSYFTALGALARERDLPYNMHILETRLQRVLGEVNYGKSLIRHAHESGVLNEQAMVIHAIWVDEDDLTLLADSGCSIAHNPVSNLKIGSGIMPFRRLRERGINVCLGNDEAATDDGINLWTVGKVAGLVHNVADPDFDRWPLPLEILTALTSAGARAMRLPRPTGRLAPGWQADIILLDLDSFAFTPLNDLKRQLVYCENGSSVTTVMVGGRIVVENRRLLTVDEDALKQEARLLAGEFADYMARCKSAADELEPHYRRMYRQALATPIGLNRWAGPMTP
ncbi:amidohydrolase family protein [Labrys portucalensis]|uniref:Amidohydrolase family protein n=1 Tax=Labrys neptuniae TaxID=376174 RepID=A0ABV6ZHQ0_9HYPH